VYTAGIVTRALVTRALVTRALVTRALVTRALVTRALVTRALVTRGISINNLDETDRHIRPETLFSPFLQPEGSLGKISISLKFE